MKILCTTTFLQGVKKLKKYHKIKELEILRDTVKRLSNLEITTQKSNHKLHNPQGLRDIHISPDLILLYKYEDDKLTLSIKLQLHDLTSHDNLSTSLKSKRGVGKEIMLWKDI